MYSKRVECFCWRRRTFKEPFVGRQAPCGSLPRWVSSASCKSRATGGRHADRAGTRAQAAFSSETAQTQWLNFEDARAQIGLTTVAAGVERDRLVLDAAFAAMAELNAAKPAATPQRR